MTTIKTRALTDEHIRLITNPHAPFLAAVIDTMPDYSLSDENIEKEAAKAAVWVSETPAVVNATVAAGTDLTLAEVQELPFIKRALLFRDVFQLTQRTIGLAGMAAAVMAEVGPLSLHMSGVKH